MTSDNPLFATSTLPYELPPFDLIRPAHYVEAFEAGMAEQRAEIEAIASRAEAATFDNTLVALERSGQLLQRASAAFHTVIAADSTDELQAIDAETAPKLSAHRDAIYLDERIFARIDALHEVRDGLDLDPESRWLLERYHTSFVRAGARLSTEDKERLRGLNASLASLSTDFRGRLLADTNELAVVVSSADELDGLSADAVEAARRDDSFVLPLVLPTGQPVLASLRDRALRERIHCAATSRGSRGNAHDTTDLVRAQALLRAERAALLGYRHHADYVIADNTAGSADVVSEMLTRLAPTAVANARAEAADLQRIVDAEGGGFTVAAWDWAFYTEKVRKERYDLDETSLRPYFELEKVLRDGVFFAATRLYGITFVERHDLPTYHPDVRVFEVFESDGTALGLFLADLYTRDSKRGGAWMNSIVTQSRLFGTSPVVMNNLNINQPPAGEPALLTLEEVRTLFHEFGHALHGLFARVAYPRFAGTAVPRDFVEYPSQVNEVWMLWPEVLANYAVHHRTGEPLPQSSVDRLLSAKTFNEGFATTEYLAASLLDLAWHTLTAEAEVDDVLGFEAAALARAGVDVAEVPPRYRSPYFAHIFSGGYSAGYYSYIWSEILDADTVEWLRENGGLRRENGDRFREALLAKGGSGDAMDIFRAFRGRDPEIEPLLARRGLAR
jgi:peptidyl-dipeptidase Dcp